MNSLRSEGNKEKRMKVEGKLKITTSDLEIGMVVDKIYFRLNYKSMSFIGKHG